jgi:hypothetical protein
VTFSKNTRLNWQRLPSGSNALPLRRSGVSLPCAAITLTIKSRARNLRGACPLHDAALHRVSHPNLKIWLQFHNLRAPDMCLAGNNGDHAHRRYDSTYRTSFFSEIRTRTTSCTSQHVTSGPLSFDLAHILRRWVGSEMTFEPQGRIVLVAASVRPNSRKVAEPARSPQIASFTASLHNGDPWSVSV